MAKQNNIKFGVQFQVDKTGLKNIETELKRISNMSVKDVINPANITDATSKLNNAQRAAEQMQKALEAGFNVKLNTVNLEKFQQSLKDSGTSLTKLQADLSHVNGGTTAFRNMTAQLLTTNKHLRESSELLTKMGNTLANTVRWSIASTAINSVTGSIQKAWSFTKQLDTSLNDIMIVTGKSADEMERFAVKANKAAKELGASTKAYSDASLIYYQQGLSDQEVAARSNVTVKAANVTGQSAQQVSEQLTAVWNGYKVSAQESEIYIDKLAAVAATTAADLEELSTGMSRVASAANIMGVDIDQLNAQLATIVSVTREAPESIGTALKTVYARMSDLEAGLDAETTLGEYTKQMANFGIQALDANGKLRDMGDVVEEIGNRWNTLSRNQQVALAQTIAGTRQYSRMMSLFDNWDMYQDALKTSKGSAGTLQKQQDTYMKSTEAHLEKLGATAEDLYASLFNTEDMNDLIEMLAKLVDGVDNFVEAIGGGAGVLRNFGAIAFNVFNKQIANSAARAVTNVQGFFDNQAQEKAQQQLLRDLGMGNMSRDDEGVREILELKKQIDSVNDLLTEDERKQGDEYIRQIASLRKQQDELKAKKKIIEETVKLATGEELNEDDWSNSAKVNTADRELKYSSQGFQALEEIMTDIIKESKSVGQAASRYGAASKSSTAYKGHQTRIKNQLEQAKTEGLPERSDELFDHPDYEFQGQDSTLLLQKQQEAEDKYTAALARRATAYDELKIRLEAMSGKTSELLSVEEQHALASMKLTTEEQERANAYSKTIEEYHKAVNEDNVAYQQSEENIKEYQNAWKGLLEIISSSRQKMDDARKGIKTLNQEINQNEEDLKNTSQSVQYFTRSWDTKKLISNITSVTSSITTLISTWQTLANLDDIWNNEDLTTSEKLAQTFITISTTITTLLPALKMLSSLTHRNTSSNIANAASEMAVAAATKQRNKAKAQTATAGASEATDKETILNNIKAAKEAGKISGKEAGGMASQIKKGNKLSNKSLGKLGMSGAATGGTAAAAGTEGAAGAAGAGGAAAAGGSLAGTIAILGAVAVIVAAIAAAGVFVFKAWNSADIALEKAKKNLEAMEKAQDKANEKLNEFNSLSQSYSNANKSLEELTKGTEEYAEAMQEANISALELLQTYPELIQYMTTTADGQLKISDEGLKEVKKQQQIDANQAARAVTFATQQVREAEIKENIDQLLKDTDRWATSTVYWEKGGSIWNPQIDTSQIEHILENLTLDDLGSQSNLISAMEDLGVQDEELAADLMRNADAVKELVLQVQENNSLLKLEYKNKYLQYLDEADYKGAYKGAIAALMTEDELTDEYEKSKNAKIDSIAQEEDAVKRKSILAQYQALNSDLDIKDWYQTGGNTIKYKDSEGKSHSIEWRDIAEFVGTAQHEQSVMAGTGWYEQKLNDFFALTGDSANNQFVKDAMATIISNSFATITAEDLEDFDYNTITALADAARNTTDLKEYKALKESAKELLEAWNSGLTDETSKIVKSAFDNPELDAALKGIQYSTYSKMKTMYNMLYSEGGSAATESFNKVLTLLGDNAQLFLDSIDLSSKTLEEDIRSFINENNLEDSFDMSSQSVRDFIAQIRAMSESTEDAKKRVANLKDILSNLNEKGDTIDTEAYDALIAEYGSAIDQYFLDMGDGTYMLTASAKEFTSAIEALNEANLKAKLQTMGDAINNFANKSANAKNKLGTSLVDKNTYQTETSSTPNLDTVGFEAKKQEILNDNSNYGWGLNKDVVIGSIGKVADIIAKTDAGSIAGSKTHDEQVAINKALFAEFIKTESGKDYAGLNQSIDLTGWGGTAISLKDGKDISTRQMVTAILKQQAIDGAKGQFTSSTPISITKYNKDNILSTLSALDELGYDTKTIQEWRNQVEDSSLDVNDTEAKALVEAIETARTTTLQKWGDSAQKEDIDKFKQYLTEGFSNKTSKEDAETFINGLGLTGDALQIATTMLADYERQGGFAANAQKAALKNLESQREAIEKVNAEYEKMNSLLEHQKTFIELTAGDGAYSMLQELQTAQLTNLEGQLNNQRAAIEHWEEQMKNTDAKVAEMARENWLAATEAYYAGMSQKIELLKEQYITMLNDVFAAQEKEHGVSMDYMSNEWDMMQKRDELYLDPVNAEFEKLKIENKYSAALNDAQSLNAQKKIKDLMEDELSVLEDKDKLSEYDLKRAEARLEVTKAQIALEEAQANKSKMRLTRGADGTYSYQYVADVDAVTKAQETLNQAQQDLYNLDADEYKANLEKALEYYQEYKDRMIEIAQIADKTEREAQFALLKEQFLGENGLLTTLFGKNAKIKENLTTSYGDAMSLLGENFGALGNAVDETTSKLANFVENMDFNELSTKIEGLESPWQKIKNATDEWQTSLNKARETVSDIASIMSNAIWGEDGLNETPYGWDSEKINDAVANGIQNGFIGMKIQWVPNTDPNSPSSGAFEWVSAATGMYTGEWGPEGKLAMLHEKELVLNKTDTANILQAVDMIRTLENALSASMLENVLSRMGGSGNALTALDLAKDLNLEQNVHITAEFPNATDKSEIEAAFDELINLATQQVFENKRG